MSDGPYHLCPHRGMTSEEILKKANTLWSQGLEVVCLLPDGKLLLRERPLLSALRRRLPRQNEETLLAHLEAAEDRILLDAHLRASNV